MESGHHVVRSPNHVGRPHAVFLPQPQLSRSQQPAPACVPSDGPAQPRGLPAETSVMNQNQAVPAVPGPGSCRTATTRDDIRRYLVITEATALSPGDTKRHTWQVKGGNRAERLLGPVQPAFRAQLALTPWPPRVPRPNQRLLVLEPASGDAWSVFVLPPDCLSQDTLLAHRGAQDCSAPDAGTPDP